MPYQPTVNDISGQIVAEGMTRGAEAEAKGIVNSAEIRAENKRREDAMWAAAIQQWGSAIGGVAGKVVDHKMENDYLTGKFEFASKVAGVDPETRKTFYEGNMGKKRAIVSGMDAMFDAAIKSKAGQEGLERQMKLYGFQQAVGDIYDKDRERRGFQFGTARDQFTHQLGREDQAAEQEAADARLGRPGKAIDAGTGQPLKGYQGTIQTSPKSVQLVPEPDPNKLTPHESDKGLYILKPDGTTQYLRDEKGEIMKPSPKASGSLTDRLVQEAIAGQPGATASPTPRPSPTPGANTVPPDAIATLKADPSPKNRAYFDKHWGPGASARVLGR